MTAASLAPTAISIRPARSADLDAIAAIENASFDRDRFSRRTLGRLLQSRSAASVVALDRRGGVAGYAIVLFRRGARVARLYTIATAPTARGSGVGASLIEAAAVAARLRGCDRLRLELRASNEAARRLYHRARFNELSIKPEYYDDGEAARVMQRELSSEDQGGRGAQP